MRRGPPPVAVAEMGVGVRLGDLSRQLRRHFYEVLAPIDRGDFRWEFLVPWANKTLTRTDKFIVCSAFIGTSFVAQTLLDPGASVGVHLSYIAQFFSYAMGDPIGFRLLAVLTSILEIAGNLLEQKGSGAIISGVDVQNWWDIDVEDAFPVFYDQLFIFINGYYILRWVLNWEAFVAGIEWEPQVEQLYADCFNPLGFRRAQFARLLRDASFEQADGEARTLCVQGEPLDSLYVLINGTIEVRIAGRVATTLQPYQLVGEASLLENLQSKDGELFPPARATIVAEPGAAYARWSHRSLFQLQREEDSDFGYAIQLMIARTLSSKLDQARKETRMLRASAASGIDALSGRKTWGRLKEGTAALQSQSLTVGAAQAASVEAQALASRAEEQERTIAQLRSQLTTAQKQSSELTAGFVALSVFLGLLLTGFRAETGMSELQM